MKDKGSFFANTLAVLIIALLFIELAFGAVVTTTMTWVVATNKAHSITYGGACSASAFYFVETDANFDNDSDGNAAMVAPNSDSGGGVGTLCQTGGIAAMLIENTGNVSINLDANVNPDFNGDDRNLQLKIWMGSGSGCTTSGDLFVGWEPHCSVVGTNAVGPVSCRDINHGDSNDYVRLVTSLATAKTNQLCFSGDFGVNAVSDTQVGGVPQGSYAHGFDSNST